MLKDPAKMRTDQDDPVPRSYLKEIRGGLGKE
jgi:hypothetical protein